MEVKCEAIYSSSYSVNDIYTINISDQKITNRNIIFKFAHKPNESDITVKEIRFTHCNLSFIPNGIREKFPNIKIFTIIDADLGELTKEDLKQFQGIKELWFLSCNIEYLPGDLFEYLPTLEILSMSTCNIKFIDPEILDNLPKLKLVNFYSNINIDCCFNSDKDFLGNITLKEMKKILKDEKLRAPASYKNNSSLTKALINDIKNFIKNDETKDFTIVVNGGNFRVHKFMLAARSNVLMEIIYKNPESRKLKLTYTDYKVFEVLLKFIYKGIFPKYIEENGIKIYKAAKELGLEQLASHISQNFQMQVNAENALEMLTVGNRFKNTKLIENSFAEIKKMFPDEKLKVEWKETIKKAKEEFDKLFD